MDAKNVIINLSQQKNYIYKDILDAIRLKEKVTLPLKTTEEIVKEEGSDGIITILDKNYPWWCKYCVDQPPILFFYKGDPAIFNILENQSLDDKNISKTDTTISIGDTSIIYKDPELINRMWKGLCKVFITKQ